MNKKNQELEKLIRQLDETIKHYELRQSSAAGRDVYVFRVNDVYALRMVDGKTQLCVPVQASLFTKSVIDEIAGSAKFNDRDGKPIIPFGGILAETFFSDMIIEAGETKKIIQQTIDTLELEGK